MWMRHWKKSHVSNICVTCRVNISARNSPTTLLRSMILAQSLPFTVIKSRELFDAHIYRTYIYLYLKKIEGVEEIQFRAEGRKGKSRSDARHENGNTWASGRRPALSGIPIRISVGDILLASPLRWKTERSTVTRALFPLGRTRPVLVPRPISNEGPRLSFRLSICHPLANCHFTDSLFCENRLHSDSNEASFTPCHASYTPLGTRGSSTRQTRGSDT